MVIEIKEHRLKILENLCAVLPFGATIFETDGYCSLCSPTCVYARFPNVNLKGEKVFCTKKNYTFLDENSSASFKVPHLA